MHATDFLAPRWLRNAHLQTFGAVQYLLFEKLYLKAVIAYAHSDFAPNFGAPIFSNDMWSGRVRLMYTF